MAHVLFGTIDQLVLVRALVAGLDASILPQNLRIVVEFLGKEKKNQTMRNEMLGMTLLDREIIDLW